MKALLFPGQGSQYVGMGSEFYKKFDLVKEIFHRVDETLSFPLSKIILNGPIEKLQLTENAQPAIMTLGVSIFNVLKNHFNLNLNSFKFFAGHSLGEYTALVCAGSLTIEQAAFLLHERGKAMQASVPIGEGAMIAVLGMSIKEIEDEIKSIPENEICEIANDNCSGQVVVSGKKKSIDIFNANLKIKNKRGILLSVSAPFHCSLMKEASKIMEIKIKEANFLKPQPSIISNVTAQAENNENNIKSLLVNQIVSKVRWRESVNYMIKEGVSEFIEIGPGKVLSGLVKKIDKNVKISNINTEDDIKND